MRNRPAILCVALILVAALLPMTAILAAPLIAIALVAPLAVEAVRRERDATSAPHPILLALVRTGHAPRASLRG